MSVRTMVEFGDDWVTAPIGPAERLRVARSVVESDGWRGAVDLLLAIADDAPARTTARARRRLVEALRALVACVTGALGSEAQSRRLRSADRHVAPCPASLVATLVVAPGAPQLG